MKEGEGIHSGQDEEPISAEDMEATVTVTELLKKLSVQFDEFTLERHKLGAERYGAFKFLELDTLEMAMEEVADLANYARYTYIKLALLKLKIDSMLPDEPILIGDKTFIKAGEMLKEGM
jgi:hypothetical protein